MGWRRGMGLTVQVQAAERPWLTPGRTAEVHAVDGSGKPACLAWSGSVQTA